MEITGIVSLKLSLFLLKMKRTIQLLGDSHSSILLSYALSLSSPKHNSSITFQIPPRMALYIFSFLEHSLTFFQRFPTYFPTYFPTFWQYMASLYITFPHSGNAWLCPRWMRSYKNGFRSTTGEWDTFSDLWQRMASFTERSRSLAMLHTFPALSGNRGISFHNVFGLWQCFITFPALSGNVTPRFRSLAVLHNVSSSLWQCYITFLTSGSRGFAP